MLISFFGVDATWFMQNLSSSTNLGVGKLWPSFQKRSLVKIGDFLLLLRSFALSLRVCF